MNRNPATPPTPSYYEPLLMAYVRAKAEESLETLEDALAWVELQGRVRDIDKFKRKKVLPRVLAVIDLIQQVDSAPQSIVEIGCGRGTALWPLMETFPETQFTGTDSYPGRGTDLQAMRDRGVRQIEEGLCLPAHRLSGLTSGGYDISLCLEVLEHLDTDREVEEAARELLRVARQAVIVSVPSVKDWNPDHKRLFTAGELRNVFLRAGAGRVVVTDVPKHFVALIRPK